mmetsp:Transcript_128647/g.223001  ORF Transcript_128647/g.223001 Transcript_128647/m.223001 type:complete len:1253 (+) Transcript_128647:104-3862(+)
MGSGAGKAKEHDITQKPPAAAAPEPPKVEPLKAAPPPAEEPPKPVQAAAAEPTKPAAAAAGTAKADQKPPAAAVSPKPKAKPKAKAKADGESSASQVVGGSWSPPKGPSPEDETVVQEWESSGKLHSLQGVWCCVPYKVTAVPGDDAEGDTKEVAQKVLDGVAKEAEDIFSHFVAHSEVSKINKMGADEFHPLSDPMKKVLTMAATLNRTTRGSFDPAILPLAQYFKENAASGDFSASADIAAYSKWSMFQLDDGGLKKKHASAKLDVCGLAKGWAIDEMAKRLTDAGFKASFIDWGGDIKVTGKHPVGRCWAAAVVEPPKIDEIGAAPAAEAGEKHYLAYIDLRDGQSIATSGDYLQSLAEGMSHIIDPKAGEPCEIVDSKCASISVVANSCMLADALATAAMAKGSIKDARMTLDMFRGHQMKDPVDDYLLFTREGPRVVRMQVRAQEDRKYEEDRLKQHDPAHVVIVGGGLAGVSAAIEAFKARAKVTLIEKEKDLGGNSAKATSGINACGTRVQFSQGIEDDGRYFERDTHVSAKGGRSDLGCVTMLSEQSSEAINWLIDELGINLTVLSQLGGHARKRTHRVPPRSDGTPVPVGYTIMQHARAAVAGIPDIEMKTGCEMTGFIKNEKDREVLGIKYKQDGEEVELRCDAVVMTTGGFGFDHSEKSLMNEFRPDLVGVPTTNGAFTDGSGVNAGRSVGANLVDMDKVQLHPTAFIDPKDPGSHTKYLGPEALRGSGGILLDQRGNRFVNELDLRSVVSQKILDVCDPYQMPDGTTYRPWAWCVLNEESQEKFGRPMLMFYKDQVGLFEAVEGTKGLAELVGCPEETILETLKAYAAACDSKICQKTGKVVFPSRMSEKDQSFIVARITPCIHYCMGGLEISSMGEVLCCNTLLHQINSEQLNEGDPEFKRQSSLSKEASKGSIGRRAKIKRLFAAGECTGGVHGGNRLGGNSLLECVVFGRLAGQRAATVNQKSPDCLASGEWVPVQLREIRATDVKYGHNTAVYRFNLHGSMQNTGLEVGRFIAIRGEIDGDTVTGYYSPISRPDDEGIIDILCRTDDKGGPIVKLLTSIRPGASLLMKGMGGPKLIAHPSDAAWTYKGRTIRRISLLAGGTGLAPALQIARAYFNNLQKHESDDPKPDGGVKVVYAAESAGDLAFVNAFETMEKRFKGLISYYSVLNHPPAGWTQGVGFVDPDCIRQRLWFPPADDHLLVMCGPPIFERIMCGNLKKMGYPRDQYYSFDADNSGEQ